MLTLMSGMENDRAKLDRHGLDRLCARLIARRHVIVLHVDRLLIVYFVLFDSLPAGFEMHPDNAAPQLAIAQSGRKEAAKK